MNSVFRLPCFCMTFSYPLRYVFFAQAECWRITWQRDRVAICEYDRGKIYNTETHYRLWWEDCKGCNETQGKCVFKVYSRCTPSAWTGVFWEMKSFQHITNTGNYETLDNKSINKMETKPINQKIIRRTLIKPNDVTLDRQHDLRE